MLTAAVNGREAWAGEAQVPEGKHVVSLGLGACTMYCDEPPVSVVQGTTWVCILESELYCQVQLSS